MLTGFPCLSICEHQSSYCGNKYEKSDHLALVKIQLEIAYNDKTSLPPTFDLAILRCFHVALISGSISSKQINTIYSTYICILDNQYKFSDKQAYEIQMVRDIQVEPLAYMPRDMQPDSPCKTFL